MPRSVDALLEVLDLEDLEVDLFRGRSPETSLQRVFGGQVAAQALVAAGRTVVPERSVHSLHAYFLRLGDPGRPIVYDVDRIRDGRSFTTRRVVARQHGRPIFHMSASFQAAEEGLEHADPMPVVPRAEDLPDARAAMGPGTGPWVDWWRDWLPLDVRLVAPVGEGDEGRTRVWLRPLGALPDDPLLHVCVLAYASDLTLLTSTLAMHPGVPRPQVQLASLDHAMWFHRPVRADGWLLFDQRSPSASGGRGLGTGRVFTADGTLVANVVQEGLVRPPRG
ncbi:acyl-CoA thioesterase [Vallicoccus soli]|uniref:Acyl-CoA thioesterase 2 n=1 Tax=Vallicoccus soli TaxID=2339232 RepID=A0A3A3ZMZ4_9ACTN|nr:acyl-CoA thioesterase II [Vallicoccus soli]RJK98131.1 acyl-CoA thioesterase II [Vallicoccus soli]